MPSDNIEDFYNTEYNLWASKGDSAVKKRKCDGEECIHLIEEVVDNQKYGAGEVTSCLCRDENINLEDKHKCKSYTSLKCFILNPNTGKLISSMCYLFETHSDNSSDNIFTELEKVWYMTGGSISKIPFILSVKMQEANIPIDGKSEKRKFPIWYLQAYGTTEQIIVFSNRKTLPTTDETSLKISEGRQLNSGVNNETENKGEDKEETLKDLFDKINKLAIEKKMTPESAQQLSKWNIKGSNRTKKTALQWIDFLEGLPGINEKSLGDKSAQPGDNDLFKQ